jgi:hypothetical protein
MLPTASLSPVAPSGECVRNEFKLACIVRYHCISNKLVQQVLYLLQKIQSESVDNRLSYEETNYTCIPYRSIRGL